MKIWNTKRALTQGIRIEYTAKECYGFSTMVQIGPYEYLHGQDWHRTEESALKRAEAMRVARIKSLKKELARLKELRFESAS